jgi:excisionase family DNA binding protein
MNSSMDEAIGKLMTVEDVMKTLRISRPTLYRLLKAGKLGPVRIGKRVLFDTKDIAAFIERSKKGGEDRQEEKKKQKPKVKESKQKTEKTKHRGESKKEKAGTKHTKTEEPEKAKEEKKPSQKREDDDKQGRLL